ncbi:glutamate 5-kinase [Cryptococcus floricola]|uniref:Glutamate 5-kinase n=1 Tax=Cryptococcus floricola TaxID=2591691 RepID=A0A5D3APC5_9TREE|nr:glutamate 5-kinase [Cryptococcus floricola]
MVHPPPSKSPKLTPRLNSKTKTAPLTIVIKLGTSSIVSPTYPFVPHIQLLSNIVETVVKLRDQGHRVVLVSSGAIGVGLRRMNLKERGKELHKKQALAAIGQGRLIALWDNLFSQLEQPIAQILLTRMDISDRTRYINAQNTFSELLNMGVVPIVNENDTVSVSEIKFGDNDTLSAISSAICHADYLFLLTDVECLYTDNPRNNPDAKPVRVVRDIQAVKQQVSTKTLGSSLGTGGMETKIIAAELATAAGTTTVVMDSSNVRDIFQVIANGPSPCRESEEGSTPELNEGPLCTRFLRKEAALKDRKWWIAHGLHAAGSVIIDPGAFRAIQRKESGGRLLPAGVVRVDGVFAGHQAVRLIVRRRKGEDDGKGEGVGRQDASVSLDMSTPASPSSSSTPLSATAVSPALRHLNIQPISISSTDQPDTPHIEPSLSLSSSIASLDPLSRSVPPSPAIKPFGTTGLTAINGGSKNGAEGGDVDVAEWEEVVVGKGLAQYNSVEIDRIKGKKSAHIEQILGYNDCEHVVDSITFI